MKKFFKQMVDNPDDTYSPKRVAGWLVTFHFMIMCFMNKPDYIVGLSLGAVMSFWALTSVDYKSYLGNKPKPDSDTPAA